VARLQVVSPSIGLQTPLPRLVGDKTAKPMLDKLGLRTGDDLLRHYPRRYVHRGELTNLADLRDEILWAVRVCPCSKPCNRNQSTRKDTLAPTAR